MDHNDLFLKSEPLHLFCSQVFDVEANGGEKNTLICLKGTVDLSSKEKVASSWGNVVFHLLIGIKHTFVAGNDGKMVETNVILCHLLCICVYFLHNLNQMCDI